MLRSVVSRNVVCLRFKIYQNVSSIYDTNEAPIKLVNRFIWRNLTKQDIWNLKILFQLIKVKNKNDKSYNGAILFGTKINVINIKYQNSEKCDERGKLFYFWKSGLPKYIAIWFIINKKKKQKKTQQYIIHKHDFFKVDCQNHASS